MRRLTASEFLPERLSELAGLQDLDLSECDDNLLLPWLDSSSALSALTRLQLQHCTFDAVSDGVTQLVQLRELDLFRCNFCCSWPRGISAMTALTRLDAMQLPGSLAVVGEPPEGLSRLVDLRELRLPNIRTFPRGVLHLTKLTCLFMSDKFQELDVPARLGSLSSLEAMQVGLSSSFLTIPDGILSLLCLTRLILSANTVESLPNKLFDLTRLVHLAISYPALTSVSDGMSNLSALTSLTLIRCKSLLALPPAIKELEALECLDLSFCLDLASLPREVSALTGLQELLLSFCNQLRDDDLAAVGSITSLRTLSLQGCEGLRCLHDALEDLSLLQTLLLSRCDSLTSLPKVVCNLSMLSHLDLYACANLQSLPEDISKLTSLTKLLLTYCEWLRDADTGHLATLPLRRLFNQGCPKVTADGLLGLLSCPEVMQCS